MKVVLTHHSGGLNLGNDEVLQSDTCRRKEDECSCSWYFFPGYISIRATHSIFLHFYLTTFKKVRLKLRFSNNCVLQKLYGLCKKLLFLFPFLSRTRSFLNSETSLDLFRSKYNIMRLFFKVVNSLMNYLKQFCKQYNISSFREEFNDYIS